MGYMKKLATLGIPLVVMLAVSALAFGCASSGSSGGEPLINLKPQYRIAKVTVSGQMDAETDSRIPTIDYLYKDDDDDAKKLDATDWSSVFYDRSTYNQFAHSSCWLRSCEWNLSYDTDGNLVSKAWSDDFGESGEYRYTYDENGNELTEQYVKFIPDETVIDERAREYNDDGVMIREEKHIYVTPTKWRESLSYKQEDTHFTNYYDDYGNITQTVVDSDMLSQTAEGNHSYEYDERGNILVDRAESNGSVLSTTTYTYDLNDKRLSKCEVSGDTPQDEIPFYGKSEYEWTRTDDGKPLTQRYHTVGKNWAQRTWEYDDAGKVLLDYFEDEHSEYGGSWRAEYSYDDSGREIEMTKTTDKGIVKESRITEYSTNGTATTQIVVRNNDGKTLINCTCDFDENGNPIHLSASSPSNSQSIEISLEYELV